MEKLDNFEPKKVNRWIFETEGVDAVLVKYVELPMLRRVDGSGRLEYTDMYVTVYDVLYQDVANQILNVIVRSKAQQATVKYLDEAGSVVEQVEMTVIPLMMSRSELDYSKTDVCTFNVGFEVLNVSFCQKSDRKACTSHKP
jgi:hypothetical protein